MFTSYFARVSKLSSPLSISRMTPKWYNGPTYKELAPTWEILNDYKNGLIDTVGYIERYQKDVLSKLDPRTTYDYLTNIYGDDVTILCYEKPTDFCHRHIVALWFENSLGVTVSEKTWK